jgi:hypothetical protein
MRGLLFFLSISVSMLWFACGTTKPVTKTQPKEETLGEIQSTIVFNPKTGKYDTILVRNNKIDTVNWKPAPPKTTPPIGGAKPNTNNNGTKSNTGNNSTGNTNTTNSNPIDYGKNNMPMNVKPPVGTRMKSSYNLAYLLPFFTDKYSDLDKEVYEKSLWALNFYAGAKMALDTLSKEGINLKVSVLDTKASEAELPLVLANEAVQSADAIIGTETNANVKAAAEFARLNNKVLISPYNPSGDLVSDNKQFVQLNPSLRTNCEVIMRHIRKTYRSEQIVVICRDKANEKEALQYLQYENRRLSNGSGSQLRELMVDEKSGLISIDVKGSMNSESMVYIVPVWGQNSEQFVYSLLTKINNAKGKRNVTVYGMPQWSSFQVNGYDAFEPLHVHITQPVFVDRINGNAKYFSAAYYQTYNAAPTDEAFLGYDITLYTGRMLSRYGTKFNEVLDVVPFTGLQTKFQFQRERNISNNPPSEKPQAFDRFANKYVNMLKFENGSFNLIVE